MRQVTVAMIACLGLSPPARACGGFFCSQVPVDQSGENIVFAVDGTTVTAYIQISYVGAAEQFAWILLEFADPSVT